MSQEKDEAARMDGQCIAIASRTAPTNEAAPMKVKMVRLELWKWHGALLCGGTERQMDVFVKKHVGDGFATTGDGCVAMARAIVQADKPFVLWVDDIRDVASVAHEALHIASGVLEARGVRHVPQSEEAYTYTMEYLIRQALDPEGWEVLGSGATGPAVESIVGGTHV